MTTVVEFYRRIGRRAAPARTDQRGTGRRKPDQGDAEGLSASPLAEEQARLREAELRRQNETLRRLMMRGTLFRGERSAALAEITELAAELIGAERVGIWRYEDDFSILRCEDVYHRTSGRHANGETLSSAEFPTYIASHRQGQIVAATDVRSDPRTCELSASCSQAQEDVRSVLDVPVWLHGRLGGILCCERVGPRRPWTPEDERLAILLATLVSFSAEHLGLGQNEAALLRSILEAMPGSLALISPDLRIIWANEFTATNLHLSLPEVLGKHCYYSRHSRSEPCEVCPVQRCFASGMLQTGEGETQDGRIWELRAAPVRGGQGEVRGVIEIAYDVTDLRRAERELKASESMLRGVYLATPIGITFSMNRVIVSANESTCRLMGYSAPEILGQNARMFYVTQEEFEEAGRRLYAPLTPRGHASIETRFRRKDGTIIDVLLTAAQLRPEDAAAGFVVTIQDITERKRAEAELAFAKSCAEHSRALAENASHAKDQFLAVLSHELRTPLTPVLATVSMLLRDGLLTGDLREALEIALRNIELEARLIDDLLDVTRIARGKLEMQRQPVELGEVIRRAVEVCLPEIGARQLKFALDLADGGRCLVEADAARLQQVFWNLLKNAVKFTPAGGQVSVHCRRTGDWVVAQVVDSGIGLDPEMLPRLFNAFQQAERSITRQFGGLGLGLAISKGLVEMHGGTIVAESQGKNQGATFTVTLPIHAGAAPAAGRAPLSAPPHADRPPGLRILLVEDHADTARVIARLLMTAGHEVQTAGTVADALAKAEQHEFDLLVSDLGLPDASGLDLVRELHARGKPLPAIAMTGYGQEQDIRRTREAGFRTHLTKPIDFDQLDRAVNEFRTRAAPSFPCGDAQSLARGQI